MNILYVKLRREFYGGEKQTEELVRGLQARGHKIFLITVPNGEIGRRLKDIPQLYFNLYPYPDKRSKSLVFLLLLPFFYINFYFLARKFVKTHQIDLVCLQEPHERIVCGPILKKLGVKVTWLELLYWEPYLKRNFLIFRPMLWSLRYCDGLILSSEFLSSQTKPYIGKTKTIIARHALLKEEKEDLARISHCCSPILSIGFMGSMDKVKGVFVLLEAFKKIHAQCPKLKLYYAGGGDELGELKNKIREYDLEKCVFALGRQKAEKFYHSVDLMIVPSFLDNLPYVLQESICAKIPVVGSKTGGIPEYFCRESKKWLFEPGNVTELADKIQQIVELNRKEIEDITARNFNYCQENFDYNKMLTQTEEFFEKL
jgi:glycosyltransferase involved in cell wall biosynthesis